MVRRLLRRPVTWVALLVLGVGAAFALYWFAPWKLVTNTTVRDALAGPPVSAPAVTAPASGSTAGPVVPVLVREGTFITHEHDTAGTARILRNPDGSHQLELVGLATSDGPDLRVWLTDQAVRTGTAGWRVFDDGEWVELGRLKGNRGDQVYRIDAGVDPSAYRSVTIWCKRFAVSFGAAELR